MTQEFDVKDFFFSPKGRLNRQPYNIAFIIVWLVILLLYGILLQSMKNANADTLPILEETALSMCTAESKNLENKMFTSARIDKCTRNKILKKLLEISPKSNIIFYILYYLNIPFLACPAIKRLHDRGKSGWWYLGFVLASFVPIICIIANLWFFIETSFLRGTVGPNDYGPDPLA